MGCLFQISLQLFYFLNQLVERLLLFAESLFWLVIYNQAVSGRWLILCKSLFFHISPYKINSFETSVWGIYTSCTSYLVCAQQKQPPK